MADRATTTGNSTQGGTASGRLPAGGALPREAKDMADKAMESGREMKDRLGDLASSSAEALKQQASELGETAKGLASQAGERIKESVNDQKEMGADYVGNLAETIRRAAREFDKDLPIAGVYLRKAAAQVENISDTVRQGDIEDLIDSAQKFARHQPTAFLGLAVLAGFGAVRFLKSSAAAGRGEGAGEGQSGSRGGNRRRSSGGNRPSAAAQE